MVELPPILFIIAGVLSVWQCQRNEILSCTPLLSLSILQNFDLNVLLLHSKTMLSASNWCLNIISISGLTILTDTSVVLVVRDENNCPKKPVIPYSG